MLPTVSEVLHSSEHQTLLGLEMPLGHTWEHKKALLEENS